jgi:hypothetical protein
VSSSPVSLTGFFGVIVAAEGLAFPDQAKIGGGSATTFSHRPRDSSTRIDEVTAESGEPARALLAALNTRDDNHCARNLG